MDAFGVQVLAPLMAVESVERIRLWENSFASLFIAVDFNEDIQFKKIIIMPRSDQFSSRTNWDMGANRLNDELERLRAQGQAVIDLTESNPTRCGFSYPKQILEALGHPNNLNYQPDPKGMLTARESVSQYYSRQGKQVDPETVILTSSTSEAYTFLFRLLVNPGEKILIARPSYPLFQYLIELSDAVYDFYPLVYESGRWQVDFDALAEAIDPKTRAIILVNPNNPTGSYITTDERDRLNRLCREHNLALIVDEVFFDYRLDPNDKDGVSFIGNSEVPTFVLNGISKTLGLPQMKLSWIASSGPAEYVQEAVKRLEMISDTFLSVNTPVQNALGAWLSKQGEVQSGILERVRRNHALIKDSALRFDIEFRPTQGGWYAVFGVPSVSDEEGWVLELLTHKYVLVHPGYFFDIQEDGFFVVSLLAAHTDMEKGLKGIGELIKGSK